MVISVLYGLVTLGILILVHELGHFILARVSNVKVVTFSIGFGRKIITFRGKETEYALSVFPLGGYVKLLGESEDEILKEEDKDRSYIYKRPGTKLLIALSGPLANMFFAYLIFVILLSTGYKVLGTKVGGVEENFPAYEVGIRKGDRILEIDGIKVEEWVDITQILNQKKENEGVRIKVEREGKELDFFLYPKVVESRTIFGEKISRKVIGVTASDDYIEKKDPVLTAIYKGFNQTINLTLITVVGIGKIIKGVVSPKEIGGPLMIMEVAGKQAKEGKRNFLYFLGLISVNLAVINLLPIPVLDGGHIFFHVIELLSGRRLSQKYLEVSQRIGLGIIFAIMALAFFNDLMRIFHAK